MTEITPLFDKNCECPICKQKFTTKKVRSRFIKVTEYDSDFCPTYASSENNPILYHVNVCPHCGFSFSDDTNPYFHPGSKELIIEKVCSQWVPRDYGEERTVYDAIKSYKLAAFCATLKKEKHVNIAGLYMRLAWLYRSLNDPDQEGRFMKLATHEYLESYMADDFRGTQVSDVRIFYLIGELSRRNGLIEQAVKYFSKVIEKQKSTVETKIVSMARERWYEIREMQKEQEAVQ
ncbi:DUF2225 domain-containing protein [Bacillus sp. 31A1R]|uniref:DUF2225 domain-containing protein n=1 Tax=Robertmurraya mangrovi TaxID=3098077 RepID=A0ABU5IY68_9BACI|nr:DUF2225 domain-containing protein [Bacillus sp. 31A1R]MDZ5472114.1 DUF2225 domain-containing protein [Bacillus sp. 31A1R]